MLRHHLSGSSPFLLRPVQVKLLRAARLLPNLLPFLGPLLPAKFFTAGLAFSTDFTSEEESSINLNSCPRSSPVKSRHSPKGSPPYQANIHDTGLFQLGDFIAKIFTHTAYLAVKPLYRTSTIRKTNGISFFTLHFWSPYPASARLPPEHG